MVRGHTAYNRPGIFRRTAPQAAPPRWARMDDDTPPPPPRRAPRAFDPVLRRALRHRMNDRQPPPDNDPGPPSGTPTDGLRFPLRSIPKWVPKSDK